MSPVTFKFFGPRGQCRRVTFDSDAIPELDTINELVEGMCEGPRVLLYRDSEGDAVLLESSQDIIEAVNDAKDSDVKSIKVHIRSVRRQCDHHKKDATPNNNNNNNNNRTKCNSAGRRENWRRVGWAPKWGRCWSHGIFGQPYHVNHIDNEVADMIKYFAPFLGIDLHKNNTEQSDESKVKTKTGEPMSENAEDHAQHETEHPPLSKENAKEEVEGAPNTESSPTASPKDNAGTSSNIIPTHTFEEKVVAKTVKVAGSGFTVAKTDPEDHETEAMSTPEREDKTRYIIPEEQPKPDGADEKLQLLKDMGFELPQDVARNMIKELNGRMDLIVRALVTNKT